MSRPDSVLERWGIHVLLLLCGIACVVIAQATQELERSNSRHRRQLALLRQVLRSPEDAPLGPIAQLDGLYARRIARIATPYGPAIVFADDLEGLQER